LNEKTQIQIQTKPKHIPG